MKHRIAIRFSINYYLSSWFLEKSMIPLPRFIYKRYQNFCKQRNHQLAEKIMTSSQSYLLHPTYYDPYFLKLIGDNPFIITVHDMIHEKFPQFVTDSHITIGHKKEVITRANRIIAISENTKKDIIDIFHIDPKKIDVIYHSTSMKPHAGKNKLQLPERYLLFVGDRTPYKNFDRFMEAFAQLRKKDTGLYAVYTGSRLNKEGKQKLKDLGVWDYTLHFKASDKALSELYARALAFVYPSLYEGFGIPILEAYACHCPAVLSNTSCFPEIAGDAAMFFDPYSVDSMADAIGQVIYNKNKRSELIRLGDERLKRYSWEEAARKTEEAYRKAMQS